MRTDVAPGIKVATDIVKAQGLISGGLGPTTPRTWLIRLGLEMLGIPHRHVTSYRSSAHARLALQQGEINFYSESPPSYRAVVHPGIVKEGLAMPVWHEADARRDRLEAVADLGIAPFPRCYQAVKGKPPAGPLWDAFQTVRTISGTMLRILALPPGAPRPAVEALQAALVRLNNDKAYAADAMKTIGFVPEYTTGPEHQPRGPHRAHGVAADAGVHRGLCEEGEPLRRVRTRRGSSASRAPGRRRSRRRRPCAAASRRAARGSGTRPRAPPAGSARTTTRT